MPVNQEAYRNILNEVTAADALLVAVSKTKPVEDLQALYELGHRDFGENYVQELLVKQPVLPEAIRWHFIGHLQTNKVKYIAPYVYMIHGVEGFKLLKEIDKQAKKNGRVIRCLLQIHVAREETKFGMDRTELAILLYDYEKEKANMQGVEICGLMAMASFTDDKDVVRQEFREVNACFQWVRQQYLSILPSFKEISLGMSGDFSTALEEGSTIVRVGSLIFGHR